MFNGLFGGSDLFMTATDDNIVWRWVPVTSDGAYRVACRAVGLTDAVFKAANFSKTPIYTLFRFSSSLLAYMAYYFAFWPERDCL